MGTVAGDDTIFIATASSRQAEAFARKSWRWWQREGAKTSRDFSVAGGDRYLVAAEGRRLKTGDADNSS